MVESLNGFDHLTNRPIDYLTNICERNELSL